MSDSRDNVLQEFDNLISELDELLYEIAPVPGTLFTGGVSSSDVSRDVIHRFTELRTKSLNLLTSIDSSDVKLQSAIDYLRNTTFHEFHIRQVLHDLQALESDYEADILTKNPRLPDPLMPTKPEKRKQLDEPRAIIIGSIITGVLTLAAALITVILPLYFQVSNLNSKINNSIVMTYTPSPNATISTIETPTATAEVTDLP